MRWDIATIYCERRRWGRPQNLGKRRPHCELLILGRGRRIVRKLYAVLDTGAQFLMLPADVADDLRLPKNLPQERVLTAGGWVTMSFAEIVIAIEGRPARVIAYFGVRGAPLVGVETMNAVMKFGLDEKGWLRGELDTPSFLVRAGLKKSLIGRCGLFAARLFGLIRAD